MKKIVLNNKQKSVLLDKMVSSARKGNLATSALALDKNKIVAASESWVVSQTDATAHAERMLIGRICQDRGNNHTPGLTLVTVVEPCLMCLSAAAWAGYERIAYIIPAKRYQEKIPWMSDCPGLDKDKIARGLRNSVTLEHLGLHEKEFARVFEKLMGRQLVP